MPKLRSVNTYETAIRALGGTAAAARALKTTQPQICKWRERYGAFPASAYFRVQNALALKGYQAAVPVFTFEQLEKFSRRRDAFADAPRRFSIGNRR